MGYKMFNKQNNSIQFVSFVEGLENIEECRPKPAKNFIPKWFRDIPSTAQDTVKVCPSFPDYFSLGYIIPMWADVKLEYIKDSKIWQWAVSNSNIKWQSHGNDQFIDFVTPSFNGIEGQFVFKAECPWRIITPPGWSVLQLPLFYHFNKEWSVLPGVIDTDIHNEINQQVLYHGNGETIKINRGDPFVLYVPFKRDSVSLDIDVHYKTGEESKMFNTRDLYLTTKFGSSGIYRKLQRDRDKNV